MRHMTPEEKKWADEAFDEIITEARASGSAAARGSADWLKVTEDNPKLGDIVWLWDGKTIWIGGREMVDSEYWLWGKTYGSTWHNCEKWDADLETDDDYKPTHWLPLPSPPNNRICNHDNT